MIDGPPVAQLGISGMVCKATGVTMRPESSIVELGEIASGVAIAASVSEVSDSDSSCRSVLSRSLLGARQPWPARPNPTRPQEVLGFKELLSELIARARMLRPHLGSGLVSAPLTFGVHCRTLSGEERCGRMIANPVKSTCRSTTPQLSKRAGADAYL